MTEDSPQPASPAQWLVHCSPERTLVARRDREETVLVKIFEQGSLLDAEQERATAVLLQRPGVVRYRDVSQDPVTGKPCVVMDFCEGENLERRVGAAGPFLASAAARAMIELAEVLADFHETNRPGAPLGIIHRDVKPANILLTDDGDATPRLVLTDLEHATARRADVEPPSTMGFTGGTHGYAPPEAYLGGLPSPGFDVFALGATLFFLLTGWPPFRQNDHADTIERVRHSTPDLDRLAGQPAALVELIEQCLAGDPAARPTMKTIGARLRSFLANRQPGDEHLDRALHAIHAADFEKANQQRSLAVHTSAYDTPRHADLQRLANERREVLGLLGGVPTPNDVDTTEDLDARGAQISSELADLAEFLLTFPAHPASLAARQAIARAGHALLEQVLPAVAALKMAAEFTAARRLIATSENVATAVARVPGGLSLPADDPGYLPGPLLRNPGQLLDRARLDISKTEKVHEGLIARLEAAESQLDLGQAGIVIDEITAIYGGASSVAAPLKDRLLRLDFYLQRVARPERLLAQLSEFLAIANLPHQLERVEELRTLCLERTISDSGTMRGKGGVRTLLETMHQMAEDFPHAAPATAEATAALEDAMRAITEQAWQYLNDIKAKLDAVPIPIRPVQRLLNRLDGIRMLEAFLDLPDRSRERLRDGIERVRMHLDQARTTRDNLARGAEEAMERGHLTTALFDMERAVDAFDHDHDTTDLGAEIGPEATDVEGEELSARLEEAKRKKQQFEHAIVENHRLAALYVELLEDESSTLTNRLRVLEERAAALDKLIRTLGPEKGAHYETDLREVLLHLLQERADQGERQLDRATDPSIRRQIAQETLKGLRDTLSRSAVAKEVGGRIRRILDHWQFKEREAHDQLLRQSQASVEQSRDRRRSVWTYVIGAAVVLLSVFGTLQVVHGFGAQAPNLQFAPPEVRIGTTGGEVTFPGSAQAMFALSNFADRLKNTDLGMAPVGDLDLVPLAEAIVTQLGVLSEDLNIPPDDAAVEQFKEALADFDRALGQLDQRIEGASWRRFYGVAERFGRSAQHVGLGLIVVRRPERTFLEALLTSLQPLSRVALARTDVESLRAAVR